MTQNQIQKLQKSLQKALIRDPEKAITMLLAELPEGRVKFKQLQILQARQERIQQFQISNTLGNSELEILLNQLTSDLLLFIDHLKPADFGIQAPPPAAYKEGHLLYQVPRTMQEQERYQCRVRIAHQLDQLLRDLETTEDVETEEIPVAKVMEVEVIDPSNPDNPAFNILLLSDAEQVVDEYECTEWLFLVRPLKTGALELFIKVSVLFQINGEERTKNVIVNRKIQVYTEEFADETPTMVRVMPLSIETEESLIPPPAPPPSPAPKIEAPAASGPAKITRQEKEEATEFMDETSGSFESDKKSSSEPPKPKPSPTQAGGSSSGPLVLPPRSQPTPQAPRPYPWRYIMGVLIVGFAGVGLMDFLGGNRDAALFPAGYHAEAAAEPEVVTSYCLACREEGVEDGIRQSTLLLQDCGSGALIKELAEVPNCCLDLDSQGQRGADWLNGESHIYEVFPGPIVTRMEVAGKPEFATLNGVRDTIYPN